MDLFEDAPTQPITQAATIGELEGVVLDQKGGITPDVKKFLITFVLTELPSAFFEYFDQKQNAIVLDFYDIKIGESTFDTLRTYPILNSTVENTQIDLNKDVHGLHPDIRNVARVKIFTKYLIKYELKEEYGIIQLSFDWSRKVEKQITRTNNSIYWKVPLSVAFLGSAGFFGYKYLIGEEKENQAACPICSEVGEEPFPRPNLGPN